MFMAYDILWATWYGSLHRFPAENDTVNNMDKEMDKAFGALKPFHIRKRDFRISNKSYFLYIRVLIWHAWLQHQSSEINVDIYLHVSPDIFVLLYIIPVRFVDLGVKKFSIRRILDINQVIDRDI